MVTEARPVDPVQPPASGKAGGVPAGAAAPSLRAACQGAGPQPRQRAQRQPQGPHDQRSRGAGDAADLGNQFCAPPTAAAGKLRVALRGAGRCSALRAAPAPPRRPSQRGGCCGCPGPGGELALPGAPQSALGAPPPPRGDRQGASGEAGAPDPSGPAAWPGQPPFLSPDSAS